MLKYTLLLLSSVSYVSAGFCSDHCRTVVKSWLEIPCGCSYGDDDDDFGDDDDDTDDDIGRRAVQKIDARAEKMIAAFRSQFEFSAGNITRRDVATQEDAPCECNCPVWNGHCGGYPETCRACSNERMSCQNERVSQTSCESCGIQALPYCYECEEGPPPGSYTGNCGIDGGDCDEQCEGDDDDPNQTCETDAYCFNCENAMGFYDELEFQGEICEDGCNRVGQECGDDDDDYHTDDDPEGRRAVQGAFPFKIQATRRDALTSCPTPPGGPPSVCCQCPFDLSTGFEIPCGPAPGGGRRRQVAESPKRRSIQAPWQWQLIAGIWTYVDLACMNG